MANEMRVTIIGNLTKDLEARMTKNGKAMATGSLAHTERIYDRQSQEFKDGPANFYDLVIFDPDAANALESLSRGTRVIVVGKQRVKSFDRKDGSRGTSVEILVEEIGPSVKFKKARVEGNSRGGYRQEAPQEDPWSTPSSQQQAAQADPLAASAPTGPGPYGDNGTQSGTPEDAFAAW